MIWSILLACHPPVEEPEPANAVNVLPAVEHGVVYDPITPREDPICLDYADAERSVDRVEWSGSVAACDAGALPVTLAERGLPMLDLARSLVGQEPVVGLEGGGAQDCALVMHANDALSHTPGADWACVDQAVQEVAASSLLASVPADEAIQAFLVDPDDEDDFRRRRWLLSSWLGAIELGSTDRYTCLELEEVDESVSGPDIVAWPPPGGVARQLLESDGRTVDDVGWTLQSDRVDLAGASVTITVGDQVHAAEVWELTPDVGSRFAIAFRVEDLPRASRYEVEVRDVLEPFVYSVEIIDCP